MVAGAKTDEEKAKLVQQVSAAKPTLDLLAKLVTKRYEKLDKKYDFDSPAWQFELAKEMGQKEELNDLLRLLTPIITKE
jgi:hypothetical protein